MSVRINFEIGHEAAIRSKRTVEGFTHDWEIYVRGCDNADLQHYIDRVVFHLHDTFPNPLRVIKEPPYKVKESGYAGFPLPIDIYLRNNEEPKKIKFVYDLNLQSQGPPICKVQKEKYVFNNPSEEFRHKLMKGGGVSVGSSSDNSRDLPEKNVNKMKSSSVDLMKKHRKAEDSFTDLFGPPITKTSKISPDPKTQIKIPEVNIPVKTEKITASKKSKSRHSPKEKDSDKERKKKSQDEKKTHKDEKNKDRSKEKDRKDKSGKRERSPKQSSTSPNRSPKRVASPKRPPSPKRPASPPPVKNKDEKKDELSAKEKSKSKHDMKEREKSKKEHKSHKEKDSVKNSENQKEQKAIIKEPKLPKEPVVFSVKQPPVKEELIVNKEEKPKVEKMETKIDKQKKPKHKHKKRNKEQREKKNKEAKPKETKPEKDSPKEQEKAAPPSNIPEPPSPKKYRGLPAVQVQVHDDSSNSSSVSQDESRVDVPKKVVVPKEKKKDQNKTDPEKKRKRQYEEPQSIKSEEPPNKINREEEYVQAEMKKENVEEEIPQNYMTILKELQHKIMTLQDNNELQKVVQLIAETGKFEITAQTFDFDLCALDRSTVRRLQDFFAIS